MTGMSNGTESVSLGTKKPRVLSPEHGITHLGPVMLTSYDIVMPLRHVTQIESSNRHTQPTVDS